MTKARAVSVNLADGLVQISVDSYKNQADKISFPTLASHFDALNILFLFLLVDLQRETMI